jgi:hypothetical protein
MLVPRYTILDPRPTQSLPADDADARRWSDNIGILICVYLRDLRENWRGSALKIESHGGVLGILNRPLSGGRESRRPKAVRNSKLKTKNSKL